MSKDPSEMTIAELREALALSEQVRLQLTNQLTTLETSYNYWRRACEDARRELKKLTRQPKKAVQ